MQINENLNFFFYIHRTSNNVFEQYMDEFTIKSINHFMLVLKYIFI